MNIALLVLSILLALHTAMGAVWKLSNSEQSVPSLKAIPHGAWRALSVAEILCALALLAPLLVSGASVLRPLAAAVVGAEMLAFSAIHIASGAKESDPVIYWLVTAAFCALVAVLGFVSLP